MKRKSEKKSEKSREVNFGLKNYFVRASIWGIFVREEAKTDEIKIKQDQMN